MIKLIPFMFFFLISPVSYAFGPLNFFFHSELAGKNSIFIDVGPAPLTFKDLSFPILPLDLRLEYLPPLPLPFSAGIFMKTPNPNLKSFGTRIGYHFNVFDIADLFLVYYHDFGYIRNKKLVEYNDSPVPYIFFDFRFGARYLFRKRVGVALESGYKFQDIAFLLSIKIY